MASTDMATPESSPSDMATSDSRTIRVTVGNIEEAVKAWNWEKAPTQQEKDTIVLVEKLLVQPENTKKPADTQGAWNSRALRDFDALFHFVWLLLSKSG
jgi:hypothetical protein